MCSINQASGGHKNGEYNVMRAKLRVISVTNSNYRSFLSLGYLWDVLGLSRSDLKRFVVHTEDSNIGLMGYGDMP